MPKSAAFIRIRADVLAIVRAIPAGRVATFKAIGAHLDVMPRHVAYILRMLSPEEKATIPWHRAVADTGVLDKPKFDGAGQSQADLLAAEGWLIDDQRTLTGFARRQVAIASLKSGVPRQTRPGTSGRVPTAAKR
jgi:methylated-DNA-protein-cysteine methyltransferase related protein